MLELHCVKLIGALLRLCAITKLCNSNVVYFLDVRNVADLIVQRTP